MHKVSIEGGSMIFHTFPKMGSLVTTKIDFQPNEGEWWSTSFTMPSDHVQGALLGLVARIRNEWSKKCTAKN